MKYKKILEKVKWEHIFMLTITFFILDLVSTYIGLQMGATEVGIIMKNYDFIGIVCVKFIALIAIILSYIYVVNWNETMAERTVYFGSGLSFGVFIVNMHKILYLILQ